MTDRQQPNSVPAHPDVCKAAAEILTRRKPAETNHQNPVFHVFSFSDVLFQGKHHSSYYHKPQVWKTSEPATF
jgi:hypothetical protein